MKHQKRINIEEYEKKFNFFLIEKSKNCLFILGEHMNFYKDTILGQALMQVQIDKANLKYFESLDLLIEDINDLAYINNTDTKLWDGGGVVVTDKILNEKEKDPSKLYVETADVSECSWLIDRLVKMYQPQPKDYNRLVVVIGFLLDVYHKRKTRLDDILKLTAVTSTIYLHPDHIEKDVFTVYQNNFPPFGDDF